MVRVWMTQRLGVTKGLALCNWRDSRGAWMESECICSVQGRRAGQRGERAMWGRGEGLCRPPARLRAQDRPRLLWRERPLYTARTKARRAALLQEGARVQEAWMGRRRARLLLRLCHAGCPARTRAWAWPQATNTSGLLLAPPPSSAHPKVWTPSGWGRLARGPAAGRTPLGPAGLHTTRRSYHAFWSWHMRGQQV